MWDVLSNYSCCIWGGSASSTTQTGCEVLCLLSFLCDWPQCLVFRHRLRVHIDGGRGGIEERRLACAPHVHVSDDEVIGSAPHLHRSVPGAALLQCRLGWSGLWQCRGRSFKAVLFPFDPPDTADSNTQPLYVGCHTHRLFSNLTEYLGRQFTSVDRAVPDSSVLFHPTSVSDSPLLYC